MTSGTGAATVNMNGGTITSTQTGGAGIGFGLEAKATGSGNAIVNFNAGTITTYGGGITAWGGDTAGAGLGNATVTTAAGTTINVAGFGWLDQFLGIYASAGSSANNTKVTVDSQSNIQAYMYGIYANFANGGDISVKQTGGTLSGAMWRVFGRRPAARLTSPIAAPSRLPRWVLQPAMAFGRLAAVLAKV